VWGVFGDERRVRARLRLLEGRGQLDLEQTLLTPGTDLPDRIAIEGQLLDGRGASLLDCEN
jgi:hypothetical protein